MLKNSIIVVLALAVVVAGGLLWKGRHVLFQSAQSEVAEKTTLPPAGPNARGMGKSLMISRGINLQSTPLFQYAFEIAPGVLSDAAKKALIGWNIVSKTQTDGSIVVTLTPKNADDQNQQYIITSGQVLYFIEQTPLDDKADSDTDLNYRDDYGIITNKDGIVQ